MFPYTLLPDGHTLEPEEDRQVERPISAPAPLFPWLVPQPELDPEPDVTSVTPMINLVSPLPPAPPGLHVPPPPTVQQPQPELTSETTRPSQTDRLGEQILRRNEERARQDAAAQNREPSLSGFPQDIGWSPYQDATGLVTPGSVKPDIGQDALLEACGYICEQNPEVMTAVMNIIEGFDPDDDEQTLRDRVENYLGIIGLNDAFGHGDWYTTRLGPAVKHTATRIVDYYFDQVTSSESELRAALAAEHAQVPDEQQVKSEEPDHGPQQLNYHTLEHLRKYVDGWDETWTTKSDVSNFIINKLAETYEIQVQEGFANLPIEEQLQEFLEFIYYHREAYYSHTWQYESPYPWYILVEDYDDFLPLLGLLKPAPLHSPSALADAFDFVSEEHAVDYLRHHLELVYTDMGYDLPEDWSGLEDSLQLANMLYTVLEEIKLKRESDIDFDIEFSLDNKFQDAYGLQGSDVNRDLARLAGTHQGPNYSLFVFVISMLWEPADWALTIAEMRDDVARGDGFLAFIRGAIGLLPGAWGRFAKRFRSADEITDSFRWFDAADQRALRVSGAKLPDDIFNRGYPEQVVREMTSGEATRPAIYRDRRRTIPEDHLEKPTNIGIKLQNDVAEFMFREGYLVESLGLENGLHRLKVYEDVGNKPIGEPDLVIWQALPSGTYEPRYFDVYSPVTVNINTLEREIRDKASRQGGHIVLNLERTVLGVEELNELQRTLRRHQHGHLREVVILNFVNESVDGVKLYEFVDIWTFGPAG